MAMGDCTALPIRMPMHQLFGFLAFPGWPPDSDALSPCELNLGSRAPIGSSGSQRRWKGCLKDSDHLHCWCTPTPMAPALGYDTVGQVSEMPEILTRRTGVAPVHPSDRGRLPQRGFLAF